MSNVPSSQGRKGLKKGSKGIAPEPPVLAAEATPELSRAFANAWTVDISRAASDTMPKRAQAIGIALSPEGLGYVLDALAGYVASLDEADSVMNRDSKTPKEREIRKPWQSRVVGVGIVANSVRLAAFPDAHLSAAATEAKLASLMMTSASSMVRDQIVQALVGNAALGTKPGALDLLAAALDDAQCTEVSRLRAAFVALYTIDAKRAHAAWHGALTAPALDANDFRAIVLAKLSLEQIELHGVDAGIESLAPDVFALLKKRAALPGDELHAAAVRYAGFARSHYLALVNHVTHHDDDAVLVAVIADRFHWVSLGANGVKQDDVRAPFKVLEKRYLGKNDAARAAVFTKLLAGLVRESSA